MRTVMALCLILLGCGGAETEPDAPRETKPRTCIPGEGVTGSPQTIEDMVDLINSFPAPVTLPCVLESLDRPLYVSSSSNGFSAQPAFGPNNPRVFIKIDDLVLSVVTKGEGRELMEFGLQRTEFRSLKAEIHFPMEEELAATTPYERVRDPSGTTCAFCHLDETRDAEIDFADAFMSEMIPPDDKDLVELDYMRWSFEECDPASEPDRCAMFDSIFAHGEVVETTL